jgi:hypothetical protein
LGEIQFGTRLNLDGANRRIKTDNSQTLLLQGSSYTNSITSPSVDIGGNFTDTDNDQVVLKLSPTYNQSASAGGTDLFISRTQTAIGTGNQYLIDAHTDGISQFSVTNSGDLAASGLVTVGSGIRFGGATILESNATDSQTLSLFHTYADTSNFEKLSFSTVAGNWVIGTSAAGTGTTGRSIRIRKDGADEFVFGNGKNITYQNLVPSADDTFRLGGASERWFNVYTDQLDQEIHTATDVGHIIKGAASQSADLAQYQN